MSELKQIEPTIKTGKELFHIDNKSLDIRLIDFWRWNQSDLIENRNRGILAEYIVKSALDTDNSTRIEWENYDLITNTGIKLEVKSAAYIQSWNQKNYSKISFKINPAIDSYEFGSIKKRWADYYVFCLLDHKNQKTIDPLNLNQWKFFILDTNILNKHCPTQKSISLSALNKLNPAKCSFHELKKYFMNKTQPNV